MANSVVASKGSFVIHLALCVVLMSSTLIARTFYVDATGGNDSNDGRSPSTAWRTLTKVNAQTFLPADTLLLKSGSSWTGQLKPSGSGNSTNAIIIDKYGGTTKPLIMGGGVIGQATLYLNNQQYWEINNLEITNDAATAGDRRGVLIAASNAGTLHHIYLKNLDIHNVKGTVGQDDAAKRTAGIGIETTTDASTATRYDDILIEGCTIYAVENTGLYTDNLVTRSDYPRSAAWMNRRFTNVRIRNNVIHHIAKNAMIIRLFDKGVVEHNVCYETALQVTGNTMFTASCDSTVFQYNEGYYNRSPGADGSMYDADLRSPRTIWQYSYSHNNAHGLFWTCTVQQDSGIICRYNVSQNDQGIIFCINYPNTSVYCYNNSVYCDSSVSPTIISERNVNAGTRTYFFYNNIISSKSPTTTYDFRTSGYTRTIDYNVFHGVHPFNEPSDPHKITSDPVFMSPGSGGIGIGSVLGYALQGNSPSINSGLAIPGNGSQDYIGNFVPFGGQVDRGAFEYQDTIQVHGALALPCDGGFEGQAPFSSLPGTTSLTTGGAMQSTTWTIGVSSLGTEAIIDNASQARTGSKYGTFGNIGNVSTKRFQSPTVPDSAVTNSNSYVVQFYYRTGTTAPTNLQGGVSPDGTSQSGMLQYASVSPIIATNGEWQKATSVVTSSSSTSSPRYGLGVLRFNGNSAVDIDVDDFAVYDGAGVDVTTPDPPTMVSVGSPTTTSLDVSWTAPATGVDGGGYMVVRGTSDPVTTPNTNGVYGVGNIIGTGQTVAYLGSAASCVDTGLLPGVHYYYRIYTVDKAYNYSYAATAEGFTSVAAIVSAQNGNWTMPTTWAGGVVPNSSSSVTILSGHTVVIDSSGVPVLNLTVQSGAKLWSNSPRTSPRYILVSGTSVTNDGTLGGSTDALSFECLNNVTFHGSGIDSICRIRPGVGMTGITITIDKDITVVYHGLTGNGGAGLYLSNSGNDDITLTVNAERLLTFLPGSRLSISPNLHVNPTPTYATNVVININGTVALLGASLGLETYTGKTTTLNVNGSLSVSEGIVARTLLAIPGTVNVNVNNGGNLDLAGSGNATSDLLACNTVVNGIFRAGSSNAVDIGPKEVTGTGTFVLDAGAMLHIGSPAGISASGATGNVQTAVRNFNVGANYRYAGTSAQITGSGLPASVNKLIVSNIHGITLTSSTTVNDTLLLETGKLDLNGNVITLGPSGLLRESAESNLFGTSGAIMTTRTLDAPSITDDIAGLGIRIESAANLGTTLITRGHAVQAGGGHNSIKRYFDITPSTNTGLNATLSFGYHDSELNGLPERNLRLFKSVDHGTSWTTQGGSIDSTSNAVTLVGIDGFSRWTAADSASPLGSFSVGTLLFSGWNLVSNPVITSNDSVRYLFPTSSFDFAFAFEPPNGYVQKHQMLNGIGYWAKFPISRSQSIFGDPLMDDSVSVAAGWNLIGSLSTAVDTSMIITVPPGIRSSPYFGYGGGYTPVQNIEPAKGYWVKTSAPGLFILGTGAVRKSAESVWRAVEHERK